MRKVQRREKNRIAAQKSRLRQTQKADTLHLVSTPTLPHPRGWGPAQGTTCFSPGDSERRCSAEAGQEK